MGSPLLTTALTALCPHAGQVKIIPAQARVRAGGQPVAIQSDTTLVAGCVFTVGPKPQPCIKVQWIVAATRVRVQGTPVLLQSSVGLCQSAEQIPQGPPNVVAVQPRVRGL